jgi:hypothetical protein
MGNSETEDSLLCVLVGLGGFAFPMNKTPPMFFAVVDDASTHQGDAVTVLRSDNRPDFIAAEIRSLVGRDGLRPRPVAINEWAEGYDRNQPHGSILERRKVILPLREATIGFPG